MKAPNLALPHSCRAVAWPSGAPSGLGEHQYSYQGISARPFKRVFNLADYVQVKGVTLENGMLKIELVRQVAEAMKPRRIPIASGWAGTERNQVEYKKAA